MRSKTTNRHVDSSLTASPRIMFIRKVYSLLTIQLAITTAWVYAVMASQQLSM